MLEDTFEDVQFQENKQLLVSRAVGLMQAKAALLSSAAEEGLHNAEREHSEKRRRLQLDIADKECQVCQSGALMLSLASSMDSVTVSQANNQLQQPVEHHAQCPFHALQTMPWLRSVQSCHQPVHIRASCESILGLMFQHVQRLRCLTVSAAGVSTGRHRPVEEARKHPLPEGVQRTRGCRHVQHALPAAGGADPPGELPGKGLQGMCSHAMTMLKDCRRGVSCALCPPHEENVLWYGFRSAGAVVYNSISSRRPACQLQTYWTSYNYAQCSRGRAVRLQSQVEAMEGKLATCQEQLQASQQDARALQVRHGLLDDSLIMTDAHQNTAFKETVALLWMGL